MSRLNSYSSNSIKNASNIAIVYFPENIKGSQYSILTFNDSSGRLDYCYDGTGMMKPYSSRAKALDAIRRLNSDFSASNVKTITYQGWSSIERFKTDSYLM